jgi:predicted phage baseplate assembly protein
VPYEHESALGRPAAEGLVQDPHAARPWLSLDEDGEPWTARADLLGSDRFARDLVVEIEADGEATLRFGDDVLGRRPTPGATLLPGYRVGCGTAGNLGAEALAHLVWDQDGVTRVRNPLPARGGVERESIAQARLYAPAAFRTQRRAVTEADYAARAQDYEDVQRAVGTRRWTGSWYTMFVTVDRLGGRRVDADFEEGLRAFLERFRLAGQDLEVDGPRYVPLDVALTVCVAPDRFRADVERALLDALGSVDLPGGRRGFFHPDNFTFGAPLHLSRLIARAMEVPGVVFVDVDDTPPKENRFQRLGEQPRGEVAAGRIAAGRLEVIRLDSDPSAPEHGRLALTMTGGR